MVSVLIFKIRNNTFQRDHILPQLRIHVLIELIKVKLMYRIERCTSISLILCNTLDYKQKPFFRQETQHRSNNTRITVQHCEGGGWAGLANCISSASK